ncbi:cysteine desulfurase [Candidatus Bathyarchaeota archaeon]|nr:cysteine desulfurase [Candidatus Bathyarchaeota archaeon]
MDVEKIRGDFPILRTGITYLDNAASSLTPEQVLEKMLEYYHGYRANVERGVHRLSQRASEEYEEAHRKVADFIGAESWRNIVFTRNTSESINLVAWGLPWRRGEKIVTTLLEHHSNYIVWLRAARRFGLEVEVVRPNREGLFNLSDFEQAIDDRTRLVAVTRVSNVLGVIVPVEGIAEIAHEHGSLLLVDGAQAVPHMETDVRKLGCDFLAFSGHKMLGPTGIGVLYIAPTVQEELEPLCIGGGTIRDVGLEDYELGESPERFEAGTPAIAEAIGLGAAVEYLEALGMREVEEHDRRISWAIREGLMELEKVEVYGPKDPEHGMSVVSFNVEGLNPHEVALALDAANIMVRSGHHCALPLVKHLLNRPQGTVRASTYIYNTLDEAEKLVETVREIVKGL